MMTPERSKQFIDVLESVLEITDIEMAVKDAANFAFYEVAAQHNSLNPNTVRDMFLRPSGCKKPIASKVLYKAIEQLFEGNCFNFTNLYRTFIPDEYQSQLTSVCMKFKQSGKNPPIKSNPKILNLFRSIRANNLLGKHNFLAAIDCLLAERLGHDAS